MQVRRSLVMASLEQYAGLVVGFASLAIVARLLTPAEIGMAAIGLGLGTIAFSLREFVTAECLIAFERVEEADRRSSFTIAVIAGCAIGALLLAVAVPLARFYGIAGLPAFLAAIVVAGVIETMAGPAIALMRRDMQFGLIARMRTLSATANAAGVIGAALSGFGFASMAVGSLAAALMLAAQALAARPDGFTLHPSLSRWRAIADFGRYKGSTVVVDRVYEALPQMVLGSLMPAAAVGIYNRVQAVNAIPDRIVLTALYNIAFPAFSMRARTGGDLRAAYLKALSCIFALYWPGMLFLALFADPIVRLVLGANWLAAAPILSIVAAAAVFWCPVILTYPLLMALGANRDAFLSSLLSRGLAAVILMISARHGLSTVAYAQFLSLPLQMTIALVFVHRHLDFAWSALAIRAVQSLAVTALALAGPLALIAVEGGHAPSPLIQIPVAAALALPGWLLGLFLLRHPLSAEIAAAGRAFYVGPGLGRLRNTLGLPSPRPGGAP